MLRRACLSFPAAHSTIRLETRDIHHICSDSLSLYVHTKNATRINVMISTKCSVLLTWKPRVTTVERETCVSCHTLSAPELMFAGWRKDMCRRKGCNDKPNKKGIKSLTKDEIHSAARASSFFCMYGVSDTLMMPARGAAFLSYCRVRVNLF